MNLLKRVISNHFRIACFALVAESTERICANNETVDAQTPKNLLWVA
jgi:hypothetical protein